MGIENKGVKPRKIPMRQCLGCNEHKPKKELIRIVGEGEHDLKIDATGKANGRGVYLCPKGDCFAMARKKRAISRSLEMEISSQVLDRIFEELKQYERTDS